MNDLYRNEYSLLVNLFLPSVKLQEKERIGSKIIKRHDKPTTPCDRLLASRYLTKDKKQWLREKRQSLNPFILQNVIHEKIKVIFRLCTLRPRHPHLQAPERLTPNNQNENSYLLRSRKQRQRSLSTSHLARTNNTYS